MCQHQALSLSPLWVFDVAPLCCGPLLHSDWSIADRAAGASWDWSRDESKQGSRRAPTHRAWPVPLAPASTAFSDRTVNPTVRHHHIAAQPFTIPLLHFFSVFSLCFFSFVLSVNLDLRCFHLLGAIPGQNLLTIHFLGFSSIFDLESISIYDI